MAKSITVKKGAVASGSSSSVEGGAALAGTISRDFKEAFRLSLADYGKQWRADRRLRALDLFALALVVLGAVQLLFVALIRDNFPFNAFLAGFIVCVGQFVLLMCLRLQLVAPLEGVSRGRALGEFSIASLVLHFVCLHFIN
ncbi:dolichyl-diphosphooligosaccharide-protein glycotransferase KNAG_0I01940 [Huiozyma naganishii CBS 8797]|uniref:Dolichyl-diphosphooligosaccharide--protein glycosyltransferase subunit OST2 n=1 Tax=Huiozyma naganishii (strain ATCC MYA-139 / BCRC 22969 / CBS 8797 / KCTC 17520 / NBRC 10181 / NCYC 3082 / Yp74L-3) TaxID=1071383 RepID=J7S9A7_HUIN7|nr:hypothetical protein KNAG_0I01940 [Kazachstania naganishii CBS 8797]CCK71979.1 hypothetical protein KNAG_0I01940 [Kazachstania naganishii CBS 8797]